MDVFQCTKSSSWSSTLGSLLLNANNPRRLPTNFQNERINRHPPGDIWRRILVTSVFSDLASNIGLGLRRFVRLEESGLSGVLLYELPTDNDTDTEQDPDKALTLVKIFGDPNDPSQPGMDVDDLLDMVRAKLVYFPNFACTSFVVGQVMTAYLSNEPSIHPIPALHGFCVDPQPCLGLRPSGASQTPLTRFVQIFCDSSTEDVGEHVRNSEKRQSSNHDPVDPSDTRCYSPNSDRAPCPPQSAILVAEPKASKESRSATPSDDSEDDSNSSLATTDSIGPRTPPRLTPSVTEHYPSGHTYLNPALGRNYRDAHGLSISTSGMHLCDSVGEGVIGIEELKLKMSGKVNLMK